MECIQGHPLSFNLCSSPPNLLNFVNFNNENHKFFRIEASAKFQRKPRKIPFKFPSKRPRPTFSESDAFPLSLPLHNKNPHSIYKDIRWFARQKKLKEAFAILDYLEQRGIPVNVTTFSSLLAACVRLRSLDDGKQVHAYIRTNGLENNEFLRTKLVHMYTSCGSVEDAQRVFDESTSRSVYPWNALLRGTVISGKKRYRDVLSTYTEMRELGVELNVYSFSSVIKSFAGASAFTQGLKSHALLIKNGLIGSTMLKTGLIDLYFKCGKIKLACHLFDEIDERDIVAWGAMVAGFAHNRLQREALYYVGCMIREGIYPNSVILTTILPVIGEIWARRVGKEVHAYVLKTRNYSKQLVIQSALVDMYCKCGDMDSGRRVFYNSRERNAISWTALMSGYVSNGRPDQALRSVAWMQQEGFKPDVVTVATALPVCAELKALRHGKEIHAYAVKNYFLPNVSIATSLMVMYSKCGVLEYSFKLFDGLEGRNVISWTAMIDSYVENGFLNEALGVFRSMQHSNYRPDSVAMARILSICSELRTLKLGKEIHGQVLKRKFESVPFVTAEMIRMYGIYGLIEHAKLLFDAVPIKGSVTWTAIIEVYGFNDLYQDAVTLFDKMTSDGYAPTHFTFKVLFSICNRAGFVDKACRIFSLMTRRYNLKASKEQYSLIINLLSRFGRSKDAERFMEMSSLS